MPRKSVEGQIYGHPYLNAGSNIAVDILSISDFEDHFVIKTSFTEPGTGYKLEYDEYIGPEDMS